MKHHITKTIAVLFMATSFPSVMSAQHFSTGGLEYNVLSTTEHTVEVSPKWSGTFYQGNITIPSTVTHGGITYDVVALGEQAFYWATLSSITIPSSVTLIKHGCFLFSNGPATINVPASVATIEELAFAARNMTAINVDADNPNYRSIGGILFSKDTATLVECPTSKNGTITPPPNTRHIAPLAFAYCQAITGIILPEGLTSIGRWAFVNNSNINNIIIPSTVSHIEACPFTNCPSLDNLSIAEGNTYYYMDGMSIYSVGGDTLLSYHKSADSVFLPSSLRVVNGFAGNSNVRYVHIPEGVNTIGEEAFNGSTLESINLPTHMTLIDEWAFYYCESLTRVGMPATLDKMGQGCFEGCTHLASIDIPNGLQIIPQSAFFACESLSDISWGDAVEIIDTVAFAGCAFEEITLPSTLRTIRLGSFNGYYNGTLHRIVFTAPVDTIEAETFFGQSIESLRMRNDVPPVSVTTTEFGADYGCLYDADVDSIIIPCGSLNEWLSDSYWGRFANQYYEDCEGINTVTEFDIAVFPNPAHDRLTVVGSNDCQIVELVNILGQSVLSQTYANNPDIIDVSNLERGLYFLRIHTSNGIATRKVILQ